METPRPGPEKLGAVRTDRDLIGLLLTLIYRATRRRQERAQSLTSQLAGVDGKGLTSYRPSRYPVCEGEERETSRQA